MTDEKAKELAKVEAALAGALREQQAWERNGAPHQIEMSRQLVRSLAEKARALRAS